MVPVFARALRPVNAKAAIPATFDEALLRPECHHRLQPHWTGRHGLVEDAPGRSQTFQHGGTFDGVY